MPRLGASCPSLAAASWEKYRRHLPSPLPYSLITDLPYSTKEAPLSVPLQLYSARKASIADIQPRCVSWRSSSRGVTLSCWEGAKEDEQPREEGLSLVVAEGLTSACKGPPVVPSCGDRMPRRFSSDIGSTSDDHFYLLFSSSLSRLRLHCVICRCGRINHAGCEHQCVKIEEVTWSTG